MPTAQQLDTPKAIPGTPEYYNARKRWFYQRGLRADGKPHTKRKRRPSIADTFLHTQYVNAQREFARFENLFRDELDLFKQQCPTIQLQ